MPKDYEVGYGRPPVGTRFRPGKSGNPSGRPKRKPSSRDIERKVLLEDKVRVTVNGRPKMVDPLTASLMVLRKEALSGNPRALDRFLKRVDALMAAEAATPERNLHAEKAEMIVQAIHHIFEGLAPYDQGEPAEPSSS